ncbi:hypothetical protein TNCV_2849211 [Trichonephila clavipes]|nr:hypothetical protein TNCV_2849211 [Trichonephila clavipes]
MPWRLVGYRRGIVCPGLRASNLILRELADASRSFSRYQETSKNNKLPDANMFLAYSKKTRLARAVASGGRIGSCAPAARSGRNPYGSFTNV